MPASLTWRTGLGWGHILLLLCSGLAAVLATGPARWAAAIVVVWAAGRAAYQYWRWNARGWRRVHFRAMLAYSGIASRERALARESGRDFDVRRACEQLAVLLCGTGNTAAVDTMLAELTRYEGAFLAGLVERHGASILAGAPFELRRDLAARLRAVRYGPELVIASVIENVYGGPEAARYAVAVAAGDAGQAGDAGPV